MEYVKNILPRANIKGFIKQFFKKVRRLMFQKEDKEKAQSREVESEESLVDGAGLGASLNGELWTG